jgi:hypothetical protein
LLKQASSFATHVAINPPLGTCSGSHPYNRSRYPRLRGSAGEVVKQRRTSDTLLGTRPQEERARSVRL